MNLDIKKRMISIVGEERRNTGGRMRGVVVSKLSKWQEVAPIILLIIDVEAQVLLEDLVDALRLPICLRMIGGTQV